MDEIQLYLLQVKCNGIPLEYLQRLSEEERDLLTERGGKLWLKEEHRRKFKVVATGGVFDVIHAGHIATLEEAKKLGDVLVVVVARDEIARKKGIVIHTQEERVRLISALRLVDLALPGGKDIEETVRRIGPDVIAFGYDQKPFEVPGIKTVKLEREHDPENIKTGKIKQRLGI